jgi:hypothetical protein
MFKKPFKSQNRNKLKRSEVRKFRTGLLAAFPHISEEQLSQARLEFHLFHLASEHEQDVDCARV